VSHGVGLVAALAALPVLIWSALQRGNPVEVAGASVFGASVVLLYLTSTLFHAFPRSRAKRVFQVLDHAAIYLLIAGPYTPFTLGVLNGTWGWILFGLVWGMAAIGILLKAVGGIRHNTVSTVVYLGMGWLVLLAADQVWALVPGWGIFWLAAGGLSYTAGALFFLAERVRYFHFVWHLFVLAGTACHFVAVLHYAA
jgi:hemolysin III